MAMTTCRSMIRHRGVLEHIDHIVGLVGIDHAGLGSDLNGVPALPKQLLTMSVLIRSSHKDCWTAVTVKLKFAKSWARI